MTMPALVELFNRARSLHGILPALGLEKHPELAGHSQLHSTRLHTVLSSVLYHCSMHDAHRSLQAVASEAHGLRLKRSRVHSSGQSRKITFERVEAGLLESHLCRRVQARHYYSCPADSVDLRHMDAPMQSPAARGTTCISDDIIEPESLAFVGGEPDCQTTLYFRLVLRNPGSKRRVGGRGFPHNKVLVSMHAALRPPPGPVVDIQAAVSVVDPSPSFFLQGWRDMARFKNHFLEYADSRCTWFIPEIDTREPLHDLCMLITTRCVEEGAHPGGTPGIGITCDITETAAAQKMSDQGLMQHDLTADRWRLTQAGLDKAKCCQALGSPARACDVRDIPVVERYWQCLAGNGAGNQQ